MGDVNDKIEDTKLLIKLSRDTISWASVNAFRRIGFLSLVMTIIFAVLLWYLDDLSNKVKSDSESLNQELAYLSKINLFKSSIDTVELCIHALEKSDELKDWYCARALQAYKNRLPAVTLQWEKEVIEKRAYGAMRADLLHKERHIKYEAMINRDDTPESQLLNKLLTSTSIAFFLTAMFAIYCYIAYLLYKRRPQVNITP